MDFIQLMMTHAVLCQENCSSTIPVEKYIGDKKKWAKSCFLNLKHDSLEVRYVPTDPDTGAYTVAEELISDCITTTIPEHQMDTRHLAQNHRKHIKNRATVLAMMPGLIKSYRQTLHNRFSVDLRMRCQAEFESAHQYINGDFKRLKAKMLMMALSCAMAVVTPFVRRIQIYAMENGQQLDNKK